MIANMNGDAKVGIVWRQRHETSPTLTREPRKITSDHVARKTIACGEVFRGGHWKIRTSDLADVNGAL